MADLKTDYKNDVLDTSVNSKRTFNIVDQDGNIIYENVTLDDTTTYSQVGDSFGAGDINNTNEMINQVNSDLAKKAPTSHASTATTYGVGNASNYGHVKLSDTYNSKIGYASSGLGASQVAVYGAYYAATNNPTVNFTFTNASGLTNVAFRKSGAGDTMGLSLVSTINGNSIFNTLVNNDGTANFVAKSDIVVAIFTLDNQTIAAGANADVDIPVSKAGYTALGIVGFNLDGGSSVSSGSYVSACNILAVLLTTSNGNTVAHFDIKNTASSNAIIKAQVKVLFIKS